MRRPAVGFAGAVAGAYGTDCATSKPSSFTRAVTAPLGTSTASATTDSAVSLILALTLSRPGRASGRVVMNAPSTSSPLRRQLAGGVTLSSRATIVPRVSSTRSTMMVFVEGGALGSGGGIRSSRSEKSNR